MHKICFKLIRDLLVSDTLEISGYYLFHEYHTIVRKMIVDEWISVSGRDTYIRTTNGGPAKIRQCPKTNRDRYFARGKWCYLTDEIVSRYRLNKDKFICWLKTQLNIPKSFSHIELINDDFWYLGQSQVSNLLMHFYFLRFQPARRSCQKLLRKVNDESGRVPAVILCDAKPEWIYTHLSKNFRLASFDQLFDRASELCVIEMSIMHHIVTQRGSNESNVCQNTEFLEDYKVIKWYEKTFICDNRQAAIFRTLHQSDGFCAHKRKLQDAASTTEDIHRIMRIYVKGEGWTPHQLWRTLLKGKGKGIYYLDFNHKPCP